MDVADAVTGLDGPRGCRPGELAGVVDLADAVFFHSDRRMQAEYPTLFNEDNREWLRAFWDGGKAVAHLGIWRGRVHAGPHVLEVAHIGAVCTLPEYRGRGLATSLLLDALVRLRAAGTALVLISGKRPLYQRVGARPFGVLLRYRVDAAALDRLPLPAVAVGQAAAVDQLMPLHAAERHRYERTPADWRLLLPGKGYLPPARGHGAMVATDRGEPVAYLLLAAPRTQDDGTVVLPVHEYAGDREAVLVAVGAALAAAGATLAEMQVQPADVDLRRLLEAADLAATPAQQQGTARILNPAAFPPLNPWEPAPTLPALPYGDPVEAEAAASLTERLLGPGGMELPRSDGLNYI